MIRSLRSRHRAAFVLLTLLLPAGYAAALLGRGPHAPDAAWPEAPAPELDWQPGERLVMWSELSLLTRLRRAGDGTLGVRAESWDGPPPPAALLYWSASEPTDGELPADARLVGALGEARRELLLREAPAGGWLVLFSLGHGEVAATLSLEEGP